MLFYSDPWKDNPYGKLKGDMTQVWAGLIFDNGKLYHHEDTYVLAANFTGFEGAVVRSFKPEQPIDFPVLATWTIHGKDYTERQKNKDTDKYETVSCKASIHEKLLYQVISDNPQWLEKEITGKITHSANGQYAGKEEEKLIDGSLAIEVIEPLGKLPDWTPPKGKGSGGSWSNKASLEDKVTWLKKELAQGLVGELLREQYVKQPPCVHTLVKEIVQQHKDDELFLGAYFDLLKGILS